MANPGDGAGRKAVDCKLGNQGRHGNGVGGRVSTPTSRPGPTSCLRVARAPQSVVTRLAGGPAGTGVDRRARWRKCLRVNRLRELPGQDLNLERGNQNPLCCQLHHRVRSNARLYWVVGVVARGRGDGGRRQTERPLSPTRHRQDANSLACRKSAARCFAACRRSRSRRPCGNRASESFGTVGPDLAG